MDIEGKKFDDGKTRWDLMPFHELEQVVKIFEFGAEKYGEGNWKKFDTSYRWRFFSAVMRHLLAWWKGETRDLESGSHHLAHAMCNLLIMMWHDKNKENKS